MSAPIIALDEPCSDFFEDPRAAAFTEAAVAASAYDDALQARHDADQAVRHAYDRWVRAKKLAGMV